MTRTANFWLSTLGLFTVALMLSSCATTSTGTKSAETPGVPPVTLAEEPESEESKTSAKIENQSIDDIIRIEEPNTLNLYDNSRYDFPITVNSRVEGWIDYFTGRGREHMERYLSRSARYIPRMKETLKSLGMPQDLVYLALIESGFNLKARSHARAVGPWQFIKPTGKRYGLRVDAWLDERRDPIKSTVAAAKYLKDLYLMFESWYLAASAYNAGEYKVLRAIEEQKTNNYWRICETRSLKRETKDYVPKLIAAAVIAKNPNRYGFETVTYQEPLDYETVTVDFALHLKEVSKLIDVPLEDLEELNPHLVRNMIPPNSPGFELRVPPGSRVLVERAVAQMRSTLEESKLPRQHMVANGETLNSIARRYRISSRALANANNVVPKEKLTPGLALIIPGAEERRAEGKRDTVSTKSKGSRTAAALVADESGFITHVVRRGESLWSISEKYDVTVHDIFKWNGLRKSRIFPGKRLRIKGTATGDQSSLNGRVAPKGRIQYASFKAPAKKRTTKSRR